MDNEKCPFGAMDGRVAYYEAILKQFLEILDLNIEIRKSSEFEFKEWVL